MPDPDWNDGLMEDALRQATYMAALTGRFARLGLDFDSLEPKIVFDGYSRELLVFAITHTLRLAEAAEKLFQEKLSLQLKSESR